ncbi:putative Outer membrane protein, OmpA/MotB [Vibrio tapetis subsp. tapetis]|uniref:Putative Outer membrane protein, OmpA/MotB n=2 Tax=Vibrio tapetis TaxID=52443 RepID=A0A2N8ZA00_9VIBR|nr:putative Outer membrane protein, OmpA/MotB [Vibrio tapetis subsp. tapetis]
MDEFSINPRRIVLCAMLALLTSHHSLAQETTYIETPVANQKADLTDDDYDGVINARDLCSGTPRTALVNNEGCEEYYENREQKQLKVLFGNNETEISPIFLTQIRTMAEFLDIYPETKIELQGFASRTGNAAHNLELSKTRAQNVRRALIGYGVSHTRIKTVGFGDSVLAVEGDSKANQAMNRRVTASVVGFKGDVVKEWTIFTVRKK